MKSIIIAAMNRKRVIGNRGSIPWHIPEDLQRFKELTTHTAVLMGRKTFESIGKPLPGRKNIVISRNPKYSLMAPAEGGTGSLQLFQSIDSALESCRDEEKVYIIGGGEIFTQMIGKTDEMLLTKVDDDKEGDTVFPVYDHLVGTSYTLQSSESHHGFVVDRYLRTTK